MSGVVRSFVPIDRALLERRLVAFEAEHGCRLGITETDPDTSYSAFKSTALRGAGPTSRLVRKMTGQ